LGKTKEELVNSFRRGEGERGKRWESSYLSQKGRCISSVDSLKPYKKGELVFVMGE